LECSAVSFAAAERRLMKLVRLIGAILVLSRAPALAQTGPIPRGYHEVWSDDFNTLSLRSGGPTYFGLSQGVGVWAAPGAWYSSDPRGVQGYGGYDWFVDPSFPWPAGYSGPFALTTAGVRIRSEAPLAWVARTLPSVGKRKQPPWLSGQLNSGHAVKIRPPFYFEVQAIMPKAVGRPFPALWLNTETPQHDVRGYEIDLQEGFGDSDRLHGTIHWKDARGAYLAHEVVNAPAGTDLAASYNVWGCDVGISRQVFYFNGNETGRVSTPTDAIIDQPFEIILDVSAGLPWRHGGPPDGGPHDMIVRYVKLFAPDDNKLLLH
jgi:hypothetical protein